MNTKELEEKTTRELLDLLEPRIKHIANVESLELMDEILQKEIDNRITYKEIDSYSHKYILYADGEEFMVVTAPFKGLLKEMVNVASKAYMAGLINMINPVLKKVKEHRESFESKEK